MSNELQDISYSIVRETEETKKVRFKSNDMVYEKVKEKDKMEENKTNSGPVLMLDIRNFTGRKPCPYCGKKIEQLEWTDGALVATCLNPECKKYKMHQIKVVYASDCKDLRMKTEEALAAWEHWCDYEKKALMEESEDK